MVPCLALGSWRLQRGVDRRRHKSFGEQKRRKVRLAAEGRDSIECYLRLMLYSRFLPLNARGELRNVEEERKGGERVEQDNGWQERGEE